MLAYIWAQDRNGLIGQDGHLPWHLPNDLQFFKKTTLNQTIVMGRKTFDGMGGRLLPQRQTIILSRDKKHVVPEGAILMTSREEVLAFAATQEKTVLIAGGTTLFELFQDDVTYLYQTVIQDEFVGDSYFPQNFDFTPFELISSEEGIVDAKNIFAHQFKYYQRKNK